MNVSPWRQRGWVLAWLVLVLAAYAVRGPLPIDETRYLSVAWEMWLRGDFLVPYLNGVPYPHKPPLLFWVFHLGWKLFGVNEWWPRLVPPIFALVSLFLTQKLARRLWPLHPQVAVAAPWLLVGTLLWAIWVPPTTFDMLLTALVIAAVLALVLAAQGRRVLGFGVVALACGLGILAKGPVMLLHVLFPAMLAPWWHERPRRQPLAWYGGLLLALVIAAGIALAWALPAAESGGHAYENAILWRQTADRVFNSFAHQQPWWWYLPWLLIFLLPWTLWPPLWRAIIRMRHDLDNSVRLCIAWILPTFLTLSLISGKQAYYILPLLAPGALLAARAICAFEGPAPRRSQMLVTLSLLLPFVVFIAWSIGWRSAGLPVWASSVHPLWGAALAVVGLALLFRAWSRARDAVVPVALASVGAIVLIQVGVFRTVTAAIDVKPAASFLAALQQDNVPVAHVSKYDGQYQFLGRLRKPLDVIEGPDLAAWIKDHPRGYVLLYVDDAGWTIRPQPEFIQPYRGRWLAIVPGEQALSLPGYRQYRVERSRHARLDPQGTASTTDKTNLVRLGCSSI
ncbi:MAG: ArnT family glycosyltransferase [Acidiferrobacterales bacterium]